MISRVLLSRRAQRDLRRVPGRIIDKLDAWIRAVQLQGLHEVRKIPGFHDEPLKGDRAGQRSIRLSVHYRAIYVIKADGGVEFVSIEEVTKHGY
jgi:toxin HigB-1